MLELSAAVDSSHLAARQRAKYPGMVTATDQILTAVTKKPGQASAASKEPLLVLHNPNALLSYTNLIIVSTPEQTESA